jgi:hypothetical protein
MGPEITWAAVLGIGLWVGFFLGCVPLFYGATHADLRRGLFGFVSCVVGGMALGLLLALPLSVAFTYQIAKATPSG